MAIANRQPELPAEPNSAEAPTEAEGRDRRRDPRRRVLKGATVAYNNRHCTMQCTLRDLSSSGARLTAAGSLDIPDTFELIVEVDGIEVECEVVWRYGDDVGVRFVGQLHKSSHKRDQIVNPVVPERKQLLRRERSGLTRLIGENSESALQEQGNDNVVPQVSEAKCDPEVHNASAETNERAAPENPSNKFLSLLITLHPEVSRTCVLMATSSCISNAIVSATQPVELRYLIKYFPRESANLALASQRMNRWFEKTTFNSLLVNYNSKLATAKAATIKIMENGLVWGRPAQSELVELAQSWKDACRSAQELLLELGAQFEACGIEGVTSELSLLTRLLSNTVDDGYPLISSEGQVLMPDWFEFRNHERALVRCPADLYLNGQQHSVLVRDITAVGMGIECKVELPVNASVELKIGQYLDLLGTIIWYRDGRAGVQLIQPIHGLDPRMMFCARNKDVGSDPDPQPT